MSVSLSAPLYFVRHGETLFNTEGRLQGQMDTDMSPRGLEQAAEAGVVLRNLFRDEQLSPADFKWFASPLSRAVKTMEIVRETMGLPEDDFLREPRLIEVSFGAWELLTWQEVRERDPGGVETRKKNIWEFVPPGGESYAMLAERLRGWLAELSGPAVCVGHAGVGRALLLLIGGLTPAEAALAPIHQGRVLACTPGKTHWI